MSWTHINIESLLNVLLIWLTIKLLSQVRLIKIFKFNKIINILVCIIHVETIFLHSTFILSMIILSYLFEFKVINLDRWIQYIVGILTLITFALANHYLIFKLFYHFIVHLLPSFLWILVEHLLGFVILALQEVIYISYYLSSRSVTKWFTIDHLWSFFVLHF